MDRDGYISNGELFLVLKMMVGNNLKDGQLQQIVDKTIMEADKDGDGKLLQVIRSTFIPNRVLVHLDPADPPRKLAALNASVRSLVEELERKGSGADSEVRRVNVRICENFTCGLPIEDVGELKTRLPLVSGSRA